MPTPSDLLLGRLAVKRGFASEEQVRQAADALRQNAAAGYEESLADVLAKRGQLTPEQLQALKRELALTHFLRAEQGFARICVERRLVDKEHARTLLQRQREEGYRWRLGDRLVADGNLSVTDRDEAMAELVRRLEANDARVTGERSTGTFPRPSSEPTPSGLLKAGVPAPPAQALEALHQDERKYSSSSWETLEQGKTIDGFTLEDRLGQGSLGVVYRARRSGQNPVALKLLAPTLATPALLQQLQQRWAQAKQLRVPGLVELGNLGRAETFTYFTAALVPGQSLAAVVGERGPLPSGRLIDLTRQILETLAQVHQAGLVHHGLSPDNVIVDQSGRAVVTDLVASTLLPPRGESARYASPEALRGEPPDPRDDLFALASVLYFALVGEPPFADSRQAQGAPDPRDRNPSVDPRLAQFIQSATQPERAQRPASAATALALLTGSRTSGVTQLPGAPVPPSPPSMPPRPPAPPRAMPATPAPPPLVTESAERTMELDAVSFPASIEESAERTAKLETPPAYARPTAPPAPPARPPAPMPPSAPPRAPDPLERTLQYDAPEVPGAPPPAVERTMAIEPPTFDPMERTVQYEDPIERTMELEPPSFDPLEESLQREQAAAAGRAEATSDELAFAPGGMDPNAVTMPMQPLSGPPPGELMAETIPIPRPDLSVSTPGAPLELDINAQTIPIPQPTFPTDPNMQTIPMAPLPELDVGDPSLRAVPPEPAIGSGVIKAGDQEDLVGQMLGNRYRILSRLGQGGMGVVYKAEHTMMGRTVAVKVLHAEVGKSDESVARFKREIQAMAQFQHPNVVRVFDAGTTATGKLYMAMEYVEGINLAQILEQQGRLPLERFVNYFAQILLGVGMGHQRGIVHRDLKTENILITQSGGFEQVKIMDFGIAKLLGAEPGAGPSQAPNMFLTTERVAIGTPEYMSPEQASGGSQVDHRSDLYSLGVVAFEMLTGRLPFDADSPVGFIGKHILEPPFTFEEAQPGLGHPAPVEGFVQRALEKDPQDRFNTAEAMLDALEDALPAELHPTVANAHNIARGLVSQSTSASLSGPPTAAAHGSAAVPFGTPQPARPLAPAGAQQPPPAKQETIARAIKLAIGVAALLLVLIGVALISRALKSVPVADRLTTVQTQVDKEVQALKWDEAKGLLSGLLAELEGDDRKPVEAALERVKQTQSMVGEFQGLQEKIQTGLGAFRKSKENDELSAAKDALSALVTQVARVQELAKDLEERELGAVVEEAAALPDLGPLKSDVKMLEELQLARSSMSGANPDFQVAINRLREALKLVQPGSPDEARLKKLLTEADAKGKIAQAKRELDKGAPDLARSSRLLREANRLVREHSLGRQLDLKIKDLQRQINVMRAQVRRKGETSKAGGHVRAAEVHLDAGEYTQALEQYRKAQRVVEDAGIRDEWDLANKIAAAEVKLRSAVDFKKLAALPAQSADPAALKRALDERQGYVTRHPKGHQVAAVKAEITKLQGWLQKGMGDAHEKALAGKIGEAKAALEKKDPALAERLAKEALALAKQHGLDGKPAQAILDTIQAGKTKQVLQAKLKAFVQVGPIWFGKYEVTNLQYLKFCLSIARRDGQEATKDLWPGEPWKPSRSKPWAKTFPRGQGFMPAGGVSFLGAQAYCKYMSKQWGITVRLPTRAEWVRAASAGDARVYPWGNDWAVSRVSFNRRQPFRVSGPQIEAMGGHDPKLKILHLSGNIAEWLDEVWVDPEKGRDASARVLLGGSHRSFRKEALQIRYRGERGGVREQKAHWGFRVVVDPKAKQKKSE